MDYYKKYLKYKTKYQELKKKIGGKQGEQTPNKCVHDCDKNHYCEKSWFGKNTCIPKRQFEQLCEKDYQCVANLRCQTVRERGTTTRKCKAS
jgi:hypothetical protein